MALAPKKKVFIYQMGKVGSISLARSLKAIPGNNLQIYRGHGISFHNQFKHLREKSLYIISPVREPIGRNISAFFQNLKRDTGLDVPELSKRTSTQLRGLFLKKYKRHDLPLYWFDKFILKNFNIDVFATPFSHKEGFSTYSRGRINLLVIQSEIDDNKKEKIITDFLGLEKPLRLIRTNVGDQKNYASLYSLFKNEVWLPSEYITKMCESKYFNYFYDEETIESVRSRWANPIEEDEK